MFNFSSIWCAIKKSLTIKMFIICRTFGFPIFFVFFIFCTSLINAFTFHADFEEEIHKCSGQENIFVDKVFDMSNLQIMRIDNGDLMINGSLTVVSDYKVGTSIGVGLLL